MNYNKDLIEIVKNKKFKTFWHCLDYLLLAGYPPIEAFGITIQEFGEGRVFTDVAYFRVRLGLDERSQERMFYGLGNDDNVIIEAHSGNVVRIHPQIKYVVTLGLIDSGNVHLSGLYAVYRKWLMEEKFLTPQEEIEETCEKITIKGLSDFILDYLSKISESHFGAKIFEMPKLNDEYKKLIKK
jgi:hypothetical protein